MDTIHLPGLGHLVDDDEHGENQGPEVLDEWGICPDCFARFVQDIADESTEYVARGLPPEGVYGGIFMMGIHAGRRLADPGHCLIAARMGDTE